MQIYFHIFSKKKSATENDLFPQVTEKKEGTSRVITLHQEKFCADGKQVEGGWRPQLATGYNGFINSLAPGRFE